MNLTQRMQAKLARRKEIISGAEAENRELTEAEASELEALAADCKKLKAQIEADKELQALDTEFNQGQGRRSSPDPVGGDQQDSGGAEEMGGFQDEGEFFSAVYRASTGHVDPRLVVGSATDVVGADGGNEGFVLPAAMRSQIFRMFEQDEGELMDAVTTEVTNARSVSFLKDVTNPWEAAGIKTHWDGSSSDYKPTKFNALTQSEVKLYGLSVFVTVEEDLLEDAPLLGRRLMEMAPVAMRWAINEAIRYGDGVGKPLGYMQSKSLVTVAKESGQGAKTLVADNVANMYTRMLPSSLNRSHWEVNPELLPQLMKLVDPHGNPLWTPLNSGFKERPNGLLLGRPVKFNEHPEPAGSVGDIQLIDPKGYYLALRSRAAKYSESIHLYFDQGLKCFRWRLRLGGQTLLSAPVSAAKGSLTKSHFVTLAERK